MRHRRLVVISATLAAGALTITSCGSRDSGSGGGSDAGSTVVIGVDAPLTGDLTALGKGIEHAVDLAVKQANKTTEVNGITFKIVSLDDQAQPSSGQQNATQFVGNDAVLGVVGPLNSSVAQSMQKVLDDAKLVQVSPANTSPDLTQGGNWRTGKKVRPFKSYFRTATTDAIQGPFAADYVFNTANKKKVFVIDDKKTYGAGLAGTFKTKFLQLGGKVVGTDHVNPDAKDFAAIVTKVRDSGADFVYYGGEYPVAGPLSAQLKKAGANIPLVGGDAIYSDQFIKLAGTAAEGDLGTSVGAPIEQLDSAKAFVKNYAAEHYAEPYETYGGYAYDAAWAIVEAVKAVVDDNDGKLPSDARAKVTEAMQSVSFDGVTGRVSFDEFGDATNKQLTVYKVVDGAWKPAKTGTYTG